MIGPIVCLMSIVFSADDALRVSIDADVREASVLEAVAITVRARAPLGWEVQCGVEGLHAGDLIGEDGILEVAEVVKSSRALEEDVEWTWRVRTTGYAPGDVRVGPWPLVAKQVGDDGTAAAATESFVVNVISLIAADDDSFVAGELRDGVVETQASRTSWGVPAAIGAGVAAIALGAWMWRIQRRRRPGEEVARVFESIRRSSESSEAVTRLRALREAMVWAGVERARAAAGPELADLMSHSSLEHDEQESLLAAFGAEERAAYAGLKGPAQPDLKTILDSLERIAMQRVMEEAP